MNELSRVFTGQQPSVGRENLAAQLVNRGVRGRGLPQDKEDRMSSALPRYYDRPDAARLIGVSTRTLDQIARTGKLRACRPSRRRVMFDKRDLEEYMESTKA
jgi:excisionase family DNA binding protein